MHEDTARDFLFADDCALDACTQSDMQGNIDLLTKACDDFGFTISTEKTGVLHQPAPAAPYTEPHITVNGLRLAAVDKFVYPGHTLSRSSNIGEEMANRIVRASTAFGRLKGNVWEHRGLDLDTKLKVYRAAVLPSLPYACETWTVYSRHANQLNAFHRSSRCLRTLHRMTWRDRVPGNEVLQLGKMESIDGILMHSQLWWAGHVHRMDDCRFPKRLFSTSCPQANTHLEDRSCAITTH